MLESNYTKLHEKEEDNKDKIPFSEAYCYNCESKTLSFTRFLDIFICEKCLPIIRKKLLGEKDGI